MKRLLLYIVLPSLLCGLLFFAKATAIPSERNELSTQDYSKNILKFWKDIQDLASNSAYKNLQWRNVGPTVMSARVTDVEASLANKYTIYFTGATSGVWKSVNNGVTWKPIFDNQADYSIGDMAIAPSNPDILWIGAGEVNFRQNVDSGNGIYKSTDGGETWHHMGLIETRHIGRIIVHPQNPEIVYVAALGALRSSNAMRGIFKTIDAGKSWNLLKYIDDETGFVDMIMDPSNPETLYAASWWRKSGPWFFYSKSNKNGIWKTTDGGKSWTRLTNGLPVDEYVGRIGISVLSSILCKFL